MANSEWFEAIDGWRPGQRRLAIAFGAVFAVFVAAAPVLYLVAPAAPSATSAPMPEWRPDEFRSGETMRRLERHLKEQSWVTFGLRGLHDAAIAWTGLQRPAGSLGRYHYETSDGEVMDPNDPATWVKPLEHGFLVPVPWPSPRDRMMVAPGQTFYLCYADQAVLHRDWFDAQGRVRVQLNQYGMRDRDLPEAKPAGERRVLCLGDSITMAWGVPVERGWPRLLEAQLQQRDPSVHTVNAGGAGTVCVDEYWWGLKNRFGRFDPDVVVVAMSCGDLIPNHGLAVLAPPAANGHQLQNLLGGSATRDALDLDPTVDWVQKLLDMPRDEGLANGLYGYDKPFESMWSQGVPQAALREMRDWCAARKIGFVVALWPFLQGLGEGRHYPFEHLHELVAAQCATDRIPFVDLLPPLRSTLAEELWVTPADMHPNPRAHALAVPPIRAAVEAALAR
jgi:lysophospholipase L1-like esterase